MTNCPSCGYHHDAATHVNGNDVTPAAGDVTVCVNCTEPHFFTGNGLELRRPTPAEREQLMTDRDVAGAIALLLDYKAGTASWAQSKEASDG